MSVVPSPLPISPMTPAQRSARNRLVRTLKPGTKLTVTDGIKKGRECVYVKAHKENPWLLVVELDRLTRIVRFDFVEVL